MFEPHFIGNSLTQKLLKIKKVGPDRQYSLFEKNPKFGYVSITLMPSDERYLISNRHKAKGALRLVYQM